MSGPEEFCGVDPPRLNQASGPARPAAARSIEGETTP